MATIIDSLIGTGADAQYSLPQTWEDASPVNLVTEDKIWRGLLKNQEFVSVGNVVTISGSTTDIGHYSELTTAAAAGWNSHAGKATNPYRYDASKGAALRMTGDYAVAVMVQQSYTRITGLQIAGTSTGVNAGTLLQVTGATNCDIRDTIIEGFSNDRPLRINGAGNIIRASLVVQRRPDPAAVIASLTDGSQAYNCLFVSTGAKLNTGISTQYAPGVLKNCYIGNVTAPRDAGTAPTMTTNFSDAAATGFAVAPFSTATFVNVTDGTHDFRLAAGSALIDAGTNDATYAATDAIGTARPQGAATDVGPREYAAGVGGGSNLTVSSGWTESADVVSIAGTVASASAGSFSTPVLRNNTGTVLASETGVVVNVYNASTGALVVRKTGLTSNASGVVTVSDAAIVAGTSYAYEVVLTANGRRLPLATAA